MAPSPGAAGHRAGAVGVAELLGEGARCSSLDAALRRCCKPLWLQAGPGLRAAGSGRGARAPPLRLL